MYAVHQFMFRLTQKFVGLVYLLLFYVEDLIDCVFHIYDINVYSFSRSLPITDR